MKDKFSMIAIISVTLGMAQMAGAADALYKCQSEDNLVRLKVTKRLTPSRVDADATLLFDGFIPEKIQLVCVASPVVTAENDVALECSGASATKTFKVSIRDDGFTWLPKAEVYEVYDETENGAYTKLIGTLTCPR